MSTSMWLRKLTSDDLIHAASYGDQASRGKKLEVTDTLNPSQIQNCALNIKY